MRLVLLALLVPVWAFAQEGQVKPKSLAELYPPLPGVEYYCTDSYGERVEVGDVICITASCQTWMARCEMTSSNRMAIWRKTQDGCPGVSLLDRVKRIQPTV
ncbi:MAG: hypothetical protein QNJ44_16580 [Rhodobacter sp.]|nr:hypothetical protein [Rhodobacter sp.]